MRELFDIVLDSPTGEMEENIAAVVAKGTIDNFGSWTLYEDGLLTIDGKGDMPNWHWGWSDAQTPWRKERKIIKEVHISDGITCIGSKSFADCTNLTQANIPTSVRIIGSASFARTGLAYIVIPNSVTGIELGAFTGCTNLTEITIPNSVTRIGAAAFENCTNLTEITIPNSVIRIGSFAFEKCIRLSRVTMPARFDCSFFEYKFSIPKSIVNFY